jgi:hypothetical protein
MSTMFKNDRFCFGTDSNAVEPEKKQRDVQKPASRWRNRYWSPCAGRLELGLGVHPAGEYDSPLIHPSRDVAETNAEASMRRCYARERGFKYLGAFPIDDAQ